MQSKDVFREISTALQILRGVFLIYDSLFNNNLYFITKHGSNIHVGYFYVYDIGLRVYSR